MAFPCRRAPEEERPPRTTLQQFDLREVELCPSLPSCSTDRAAVPSQKFRRISGRLRHQDSRARTKSGASLPFLILGILLTPQRPAGRNLERPPATTHETPSPSRPGRHRPRHIAEAIQEAAMGIDPASARAPLRNDPEGLVRRMGFPSPTVPVGRGSSVRLQPASAAGFHHIETEQ